MAAFILNPYDQVLDLTIRDHLNIYFDGSIEITKKVRFDRK